MRTIKFRAWNGVGMIYGGFSIHATGNFVSSLGERVLCGLEKDETPPVMQFTGLTDKNGNEIYEGDVVYLAGFGDYVCEFPFIDLYEAMAECDIGAIKGNIYQNPDLIPP